MDKKSICSHCGKEYVKVRFTNTCSSRCYYARQDRKKYDRVKIKEYRKLEYKSLPKNVARRVSKETKEAVFLRDGGKCVCCGTRSLLERVPHHVFYGSESNYSDTRNDTEELVTICRSCHTKLHFEENGSSLRLATKKYLFDLYGYERYSAYARPIVD